MEIRISKSNLVHIKNTSNVPIKILVAPNKDWIMGDLAFTVAKAAFTFGASTAAETAAKTVVTATKTVFQTGVMHIKNLHSIYKVYSKVKKVSKLQSPVNQQRFSDSASVIEKIFEEGGITIAPGEYKVVNEKALLSAVTGVMRYIVTPALWLSQIDNDSSKDIMEVDKLLSNGKAASVGDAFDQVSSLLGLANPSSFSSIFSSVGDLTLFITTAKYDKFVSFNTNSDHSWIVKENDVVRAKYGTTDKEDIEEGRHFFSLTLGEALQSGDTMDPYDSLDVVTSNYNLIPEVNIPKIPKLPGATSKDDDGVFTKVGNFLQNAHALVENTKTSLFDTANSAISGAINFPKYVGSAPYKLAYQPDGNLVLYRLSGDHPTPKWATNTDKKSTYKTIMQEDGNLVVYAAPGKPVWALWRSPKPQYAGAYIQLDNISGNINYFRKGAEDPDFAINELPSIRIGDTFYPALPDNK